MNRVGGPGPGPVSANSYFMVYLLSTPSSNLIILACPYNPPYLPAYMFPFSSYFGAKCDASIVYLLKYPTLNLQIIRPKIVLQ